MKEIVHVDIRTLATLKNMLEPLCEKLQAHRDGDVGDFVWPGMSPFIQTLSCQLLTEVRGEHQGGRS